MRCLTILLSIFLILLFCGCSGEIAADDAGGPDTLRQSDTDSPVSYNFLAMKEYEFNLTHPEPDGSTASMTAYANEYLEFWESEAALLTEASSEVAEEYEEFKSGLDSRLSQLAEEYKESPDAPYGSLAAPNIIMERAEAVKEFVISHLG